MGQYWLVTNLDKREFIHPHEMGDGLKLMEQVLSGGGGTGSALLLLTAASNGEGGRGGGDYHPDDPNGIVGRWAGDRIALVGDYAEATDLPARFQAHHIYDLCGDADDDIEEQYEAEAYTNITAMVKAAIEADGYVRYKEDEYGVMRRYMQGDPGFDDEGDTEGWYRVVVEPLNEGPYEGAAEFKWWCNHYNHALNKAKKRGLTAVSIVFLGKE